MLAVDAINSSLKRIVGYLNAMSGPQTSVIAVEYTRLYGPGLEILMPRTYGLELAEEKVATAEKNKERWTLEQNRRWIEEHDAGNLDRFQAIVDGAAEANIPFVGSPVGLKSDVPAGGLQLALPSGDVVGTVYVYHYRGKSTSIEFNFTAGREMLKRDAEVERRFEDLLKRRWLTYELDPQRQFEFPMMSDASFPPTAAMIRAMRSAEQEKTAGVPANYKLAVDRFLQNLEAAERAAGVS